MNMISKAVLPLSFIVFIGCGEDNIQTNESNLQQAERFSRSTGCEMIVDLENTGSQNAKIAFYKVGEDILESEKGFNLIFEPETEVKEGTYFINVFADYESSSFNFIFPSGKVTVESTLYKLENGRKRKISVESEEFKVRNARNIQSVVEEGIENTLRKLPNCSRS